MLVVWYPLFEHPCCNAKGDVYAKERILRVDDGTLEDACLLYTSDAADE